MIIHSLHNTFCVFQDYVSIVPVFYPGPSKTDHVPEKRNENVLEEIVTRTCEVNGENELDDLCVQYSYIDVNKPGFVRIQAEEGYVYDRNARRRKSTQVFEDEDILKELDFSVLALLNRNQVSYAYYFGKHGNLLRK